MTVLRPRLEGDAERQLGPTVTETLNNNVALDAAYRGVNRGTLLFNVPGECRLSEFDEASPWQPAYTWLSPQVTTTGDENRRRYAHALATLDSQSFFEGGWTPNFGQEQQTKDIRDALAQLPAVPFRSSGPQVQPAVVKTALLDGRTWLYVVNDSALPIRAELKLSCPAATVCRRLGKDQAIALRATGDNRSVLTLSLRGYDVWCCQLNHPQAEVMSTQVSVADAALAKLQDRIERLHEQMQLTEGDTKPHGSPLTNPGFEQVAARRQNLPGWDLSVQQAAYWTLDGENPHSGKSALRLTASENDSSLVSPELALGGSRFLTMTLWMRSQAATASAKLIFDCEVDGAPHRQLATVAVGTKWERFLFRVNNIPPGKLEHPRVRVEPLGPGPLWIDDVEISSQRLTPEEVRQLTKTVSAVQLAWEERRYADCQRLIDGYWGQLLLASPAGTPGAEDQRPRVGNRVKGLFRK